MPELTDPFAIGGVDGSPTASCSRRWPASATGSCACRPSATAPAWRSRRWSRASRSTTATRRRCTELLRIHPDERDGRAGRDPALRPGPRGHALGRRDGRRARRRRHRPQHGLPGAEGLQDRRRRGADQGPRHRRRGRPRGARGQRPAGDRQAALRPARRATTDGVRRSPTGSSTRPASPRSPSTRAAPQVHHKGTPDYELAARLVGRAAGARDPLRRPARRASAVRAAYERTGAAAVMLARGALGNPWLFEQLLGLRDERADAATRSSPSSTGSWTAAVEHLGAGPRRALPAQVLPLVPGRAWARPGGSRTRCSRPTSSRREANAALDLRAACRRTTARLTAARPAACYTAAPSCHAQGRHPHPGRPREAQGGARGPARPTSAARSPSASRRRASSATSRRTPSTTTPRTSRPCSRRGSRSSRSGCAPRR